MVGHAKSQEVKNHEKREATDELYAQAKDLYIAEHKDPVNNARSYMKICDDVSKEHFERTGKHIQLSSSTLRRHVNGGRTKSETSAQRSHFTKEEQEVIVTFAIDMAQ